MEEAVIDLLEKLNISQYKGNFEDEGFTTLDSLRFITEEDFETMEVKRGHRRLLQSKLEPVNVNTNESMPVYNPSGTSVVSAMGSEKKAINGNNALVTGEIHQPTSPQALSVKHPHFDIRVRNKTIELSRDHMTCSSSAHQWGTVMVAQQKAATEGIHFWSFKIHARQPGGGILIGVANADYDATKRNVGAQGPSWGLSGASGEIGDGSGEFFPFGTPFNSGDEVSILLDFDMDCLRFYKNREDLGVAFAGCFRGLALLPAVCLGGATSGEHVVELLQDRPLPHIARVFHPELKADFLELKNGGRTVTNITHKWGSLVVFENGVTEGIHYWEFKISSKQKSGGVLVGVAADDFDARRRNIGAQSISWGLSGGSGDIGDGSGDYKPFSQEGFGNGDIVGVYVNMDKGSLRFFKNGVDMGQATRDGLKGLAILPGVCISGPPKEIEVTVLPPTDIPAVVEIPEFDPERCNKKVVVLSNRNQTVSNPSEKWASVLLQEEPLVSGCGFWEFRVDQRQQGGGILIGCCDADFEVEKKNIGAQPTSWGMSGASGDIGDGSGEFMTYSKPFNSGDQIGMLVNMDVGTIRFFKNGQDLGIAASENIKGRAIIPGLCLGGCQSKEHRVTLMPKRAPPTFLTTPPELVAAIEPKLRFSKEMKSKHVRISSNRLVVSNETEKWGSCRLAVDPVTKGVHYWKFEVERREPGGGILIGVCAHDFDCSRRNVGAQRVSWGVSGASGEFGNGSGKFIEYSKPYHTGDSIGMLLDMNAGTLRYFKNDIDMGIACSTDLKGRALCPAVCLGGATNGGEHRISVSQSEEVPFFEDPLVFSVMNKANSLTLSADGSNVSSTSNKWGSVLLDVEPVTEGCHYWEFEIDNRADGGGILLGIAAHDFEAKKRNVGAQGVSWGMSGASGDIGDGSGDFKPFTEPFDSGDQVGLLLDMDIGTLRYFRNGEDLGIAFSTNLKGLALLPAVCLGGAAGGHHSVTVKPKCPVPELPTVFSTDCRADMLELQDGGRTVSSSSQKWGSALVDVAPISEGTHYFEFQINARQDGGGVLVGVAAHDFDARKRNVGAQATSWGISGASGDIGNGHKFVPFDEPFDSGDVVGVLVDMDVGSLRFFKNNKDLGLAEVDALNGLSVVPAVCLGGCTGGAHSVSVLQRSKTVPTVDTHAPVEILRNEVQAAADSQQLESIFLKYLDVMRHRHGVITTGDLELLRKRKTSQMEEIWTPDVGRAYYDLVQQANIGVKNV